MAMSATAKIMYNITSTGRRQCINLEYAQICGFLQVRNYAARKGTREKARKKKVKVVVEKVGFIPHKDRGNKEMVLPLEKVRLDDSWKQDLPSDDVWLGKYYKWKTYSFAEAAQCHKETHSIGMYDAPNAFIKAKIELNMTGPKPSRPVTKFERLVVTPHAFNHGEIRRILAFCKTSELQEQAKQAGATIVGGTEIISQIQTGDLSMTDYDYIVAHPNMMADIVGIKGLMKKKFPSAANGSLGINIPQMIHKFMHGIKYAGRPHERQHLYGIAEANFGRLDMDTKHLEDNLSAVIRDLDLHRPKRPGPFITRILITTELAREFLKIDHKLYTIDTKDEDDDDDEDDEGDPVAVAL